MPPSRSLPGKRVSLGHKLTMPILPRRFTRRCASGPTAITVKRRGLPKLRGWVVAFGVDEHGNAITHTDTGCIRVIVARIADLSEALAILKCEGFNRAALRCTAREPFTAGDIFTPSSLTPELRDACKDAEAICDDGKTFKDWLYKPYLIQALATMPARFPRCTGPVIVYIPSTLCPTHKFSVVGLY